MRRALVVLLALLALAPAAALAQGRTYVPFQAFTTTSTGATFTVPLLLPDGSVAAPALGAASNTDTGLYFSGNSTRFTSDNNLVFSVSTTANFSNGPFYVNGGVGHQNYLGFGVSGVPDTLLYRDAANTLALRNSTNAQALNLYNTYSDASNYERGFARFTANVFLVGTESAGTGTTRPLQLTSANGFVTVAAALGPSTDDTRQLGIPPTAGLASWQNLYLSRSIQGSKSKTVVDNVSTSFVRITVADDDYEACAIGWTAYAEDADTDARQVRKGRTNVAILNNSGTETASFSASADDQVQVVTAGTLAVSFSNASAVADTIDLYVTVNTSLDAAAETLTFEYRLDCESTTTVTPQ